MNLRKPLPLLAAVLVVGVGAPAALATADLNGGAHGDTTTQGELGTAEHGQSGVNEADGQALANRDRSIRTTLTGAIRGRRASGTISRSAKFNGSRRLDPSGGLTCTSATSWHARRR